jgi:hypothetical protein
MPKTFPDYKLIQHENGLYQLYIMGTWQDDQLTPCEPHLLHSVTDKTPESAPAPKCLTSFDLLWCKNHEQAEDGKQDNLGNWWCLKCSLQRELIGLGSKLNFKALLDGKQEVINAGQMKWIMFARTMGYHNVEQAVKLIGKPTAAKK